MLCRDSGLPRNTRNIMCTSGNVFERPPTRKEQTSTLFNNLKNLAFFFSKIGTEGNSKKPESEMRREPQQMSIPMPRFQKGGGILDHTGGTYSHSGVIDYPRIPVSELQLEKFPDSMEFQSWKVNDRLQGEQISPITICLMR